MELLSPGFRTALEEIAAGPVPLLATITAAPHPWADAFKRRPGAVLYPLTPANRDRMLETVEGWLRAHLGPSP